MRFRNILYDIDHVLFQFKWLLIAAFEMTPNSRKSELTVYIYRHHVNKNRKKKKKKNDKRNKNVVVVHPIDLLTLGSVINN